MDPLQTTWFPDLGEYDEPEPEGIDDLDRRLAAYDGISVAELLRQRAADDCPQLVAWGAAL